MAERKVRKLLEECQDIRVVSKKFTAGLKALGRRGSVRLLEAEVTASHEALDRVIGRSDIVIVATDDPAVNGEIAAAVKRKGLLINAVDNPAASGFTFPAGARVGDVRIAVSTGGRSPAMARLICKKLSKHISKDDQLQVGFQARIRKYARRELPDPESRKRALYGVIRNGEVRGLLRSGRIEDAKEVAERIVVQGRRRATHR